MRIDGKVVVKDIPISYKNINQADYISLIDIAKFREAEFPSDVIQQWMRSHNTVEYLGTWERINNSDFNYREFEVIDKQAGRNGFVLTPKRWIESVKAIGIIAKQGRYSEVFAHKDIAFKFASWLSVEFELYMIKEFQRLKENEQKQVEWTAKRELAKVNYHIHTDAIKTNLIVPKLTQQQIGFVYASEADRLNVALFGCTAGEWRQKNPKEQGNIRDFATVQQLLVLANMESYNAVMINGNISAGDRLVRLNDMARQQIAVLQNTSNNLLLKEVKK